MNKIKLKNITLKDNLELYKLSEYVGISVQELKENILGHLVRLQYLLDLKTECGEYLIDILGENMYEVRNFCQNIFKIWTPKLEMYLKEIMIWGYYDCPSCGNELKYQDTLGTCNNCGYQRGINYFPEEKNCHKELIQSITFN